MNAPSVIVCERSGKWATALGRHLPPALRVRQTRALSECIGVLAAAPASFLALEATRENLTQLLSLLGDFGHKFPLARALVLADRGFERYEGLFREAGAVHFSVSPRESAELARLAGKHLGGMTPARVFLAEQVWDTLPWSEVA